MAVPPHTAVYARVRFVVWVHVWIRVLFIAVAAGLASLYMLLSVEGRFRSLVESGIFWVLGFYVTADFFVWHFLPKALYREFADVEKFLEKPAAATAPLPFASYRDATLAVAAKLKHVYFVIYFAAIAFVMTYTFFGSAHIPWMTATAAPWVFVYCTVPFEALMILVVLATLPLALPGELARVHWRTLLPQRVSS